MSHRRSRTVVVVALALAAMLGARDAAAELGTS
jgi:hypothetical protein